MTGKILGLPCQSASYPLALARNAVFEKPRSGPALEGDWQTGKVLSLVKVEEESDLEFILARVRNDERSKTFMINLYTNTKPNEEETACFSDNSEFSSQEKGVVVGTIKYGSGHVPCDAMDESNSKEEWHYACCDRTLALEDTRGVNPSAHVRFCRERFFEAENPHQKDYQMVRERGRRDEPTNLYIKR